ncbi:MAG: hypothetical protein ACHRHE_22590 [Tepidisphaerales bacterium]
MLILKKIGAIFFVIGLAGILGPFVGIGLKGLAAGESRIAGAFLMGLGAIFWLIAIGAEKLQESMRERKLTKMREDARVPDDIIK